MPRLPSRSMFATDWQGWLQAIGPGSTLAALAAIAIAVYGNRTNRRLAQFQRQGEHERWLADKRREAYSEFLDVVGVAYEAVEARARIDEQTSAPEESWRAQDE